MGASGGRSSRGPRLALLVAIAALFALIPAAQASADFTLKVNVVGEGEVWCESEYEVEGELEFFYEECEEKAEYPEGTEVFLEAIELGDEFKEFKGCEVTGPEECKVTMDEDHEVTVVFGPEPVAKHKLKVNVVGGGEVECELEEGPEPCLAEYPEEGEFGLTEVTLVPVEDAGSEFVGFSGDCSGEKCVLTMDEDHSVTATFKAESGGGGEEESEEEAAASTPPKTSVPAPTGLGKARVSGAGLYRAGKATVRLTCKGDRPCKGTVRLIAKLKVGKKGKKKVTVGKAPFSLPAGSSKTLTIKLTGPAKKLLGKGRTLTAKVRGDGVTASKVKIIPSAR